MFGGFLRRASCETWWRVGVRKGKGLNTRSQKYLFHRYFCDLVLSPFPLRTPTRHHVSQLARRRKPPNIALPRFFDDRPTDNQPDPLELAVARGGAQTKS